MLFDNTSHSYCTALRSIGPAMAHSFAGRVSAFFYCTKAFTMNLITAGWHWRAAMWAVRSIWLLYVGENAAPIISGSIMGSEQPPLADFYEAPQRLSSIFASYSCLQRETLSWVPIMRVPSSCAHLWQSSPGPGPYPPGTGQMANKNFPRWPMTA